MNKMLSFKKIVSIGFFAAFFAVFLSAGTAQAGFWDWLNINKANKDSQQAAVSGSKTYTLRVNKSGYGGNYRNITSSDKKINCGFDCSERYLDAQTVTLTAISKSNDYSFDRWTGGGCSGSGSCVVEVNKPNGTVSVRAIFKKGPSASRDASETVPSVPSNFTATTGSCGSGSINLSWNKVNDANQYRVKKTDISNVDRVISLGDVSSYTDTSVLNENLTFKYSVAACSGSDCSAYSNSVSTNSPSQCSSSSSASLTAKTGNALDITPSSASLNGTINPKGENVSVYFKYRKESESAEATKTTDWMSTGSRSNDFTASVKISGLSSGTKYVYRFYAYNHTSGKTIYGDLKSFRTSSGSSNSSSAQSSSSSVSSGASSSSSSVQQYTLKVKISGAGQVSGGGIKCKKSTEGKYSEGGNWTCSVKINKGAEVTLYSSEPSTQYKFATWADDCRAFQKSTSCNFKMSGNKTVSATFNKKGTADKESVSVSVRKTGKGVGKIVSINYSGKEISGINCGSNCSENYEKNCVTDIERYGGDSCATVYFRAVAEKGSTFSGWGGDCLTFKNEKDQCYVILDGNKTINANFNEGSNNAEGKNYNLKVTAPDNGVIASTDGKINCGSGNIKCDHSYGKNGTVTLKATPNSGYALSSTSGCRSKSKNNDGSYNCKVKMTKDQNVKINFKTSSSSSSSSSVSSSSSSLSFSTNLKVITESAENVTSDSATLKGTVNPKNENVIYKFYYVKRNAPETQKWTSWSSSVSGSSDISATADISGLSSGTTYNFAIHAYSYTSKKYTRVGNVKSFTTLGGSSNSSSSFSSSSQSTASTYKLKITVQGIGKVEDNYSKISCGSNMACEATYSKGQVITLKTEDTDSSGASFGTKVDSWSGGGCSGTSNACFITMNENKEITIKFVNK